MSESTPIFDIAFIVQAMHFEIYTNPKFLKSIFVLDGTFTIHTKQTENGTWNVPPF